MTRVVRPGGRVVVLEITAPQKPPLSWFFRAWFDHAVPALGRVAGADGLHLPAEQRAPLPRPRGARGRMAAAAGLADVRWILTAGASSPSAGTKPAS